MSNKVFISYDEEPPLSSIVDESELVSFVLSVLEHRGHSCWEVSLLITDDSSIQILNNTYRNIDSPTDVLSFQMGEEYVDLDGKKRFVAGDIVVSLESVSNNASTFLVSLNEEFKRVIIHSILHLEGMDHASNDKNEPMLLLQEEILECFKDFYIIKE